MPVPGSAHNNLPESPELVTQVGRKRLRSPSMQSDSGASSSSVKRSVADNSANETPIRSLRSDQPSTFNSTDLNQDIDAYMAEQGEANIPTFIPSPSQPTPAETPSRDEKLSRVQNGKARKMEIGETWYLVSHGWYKRFRKACTGEIDKEGLITEQELGPITNTSLLDSYGNLLPALAEGVDVEYVPQEVWEQLVKWYGAPVHPLPRRIIARGASKLPALELRPLRLKVFKLIKGPTSSSNPSHPWIEISAGETLSVLCTKLADAIAPGTEIQIPYRIWKISAVSEEQGIEFPASELSDFEASIVEESSKTLEEEGLESEDAFVVEFKGASGWLADVPKTTQKEVITESVRTLFNSNEGFFNKMSTSISPVTVTTQTFKPSSYDGGSSSKTASTALTWTNNKAATKTLEVGTIGLGNMGNTCFMNSALQCLAHNQELTEYFLTGVYSEELNKDNPLGMGGAIAEAFGALLQRIWATSGVSSSYTPREFKSQLQRFAPQFTGYQQHDSQELVAFLLDGLHEDLNRVIKKPYVEKPDWEGGGDLELVQLAQKSWEGYMLRNDSVIVDLFQGQYQSTLICPECQKVSITFDPFMYLTLPLPIQKKWTHSIFYIPWHLDKPHVKIPVEINRDASFKELRALLGRWMGAPAENLLTMEVFNHRFYKNLDDSVSVGEMGDSDTVVCFELPCNARQSRTHKSQPDQAFILPVFLWDAKPPSTSGNFFSSRSNSSAPFGYPMVIALTQEQASDVNTMYELVTERLQRWTANARDLFAWEVNDDSEIKEVPIEINGFPPIESITEITEDGNVVTVQTTPPLEGDIVDEKSMVVDAGETDADVTRPLRKIGPKKDVFNLRLQVNHKDLGVAYNTYQSNNRWESWDSRLAEVDTIPVLLRENDALYCEFDEDKKAYFFGDNNKFEHALWNNFELFTHPEFTENHKAHAAKRHKGISLQDCLDEFTKEEQLGEDDLWYCPQCKKHQQATKKFDLWKVPDILVVHLKRFSNSRTLRDKIDAHVEFPIEGLDLGDMAGERNVAKRLIEQGVAAENLNLGDLDEPLVYDLFGVDEHIGGLGGGHYRAYAHNHLTDKWYHFDDSYVTPARPSESVNPNAYLLFYRRRTASHLGGKSFQKTQEAKLQPKVESTAPLEVIIGTQLPTPPNEQSDDRLPFFSNNTPEVTLHENDHWNLRSSDSTAGSSVPSPPTDEPPDFDDYGNDPIMPHNNDPLILSTQRYDFPDPSNKASPTSSNEAELDTDLDQDVEWKSSLNNFNVGVSEVKSPEWDEVSNHASPSYSDSGDPDPFSDTNVQKDDKTTTIHEK